MTLLALGAKPGSSTESQLKCVLAEFINKNAILAAYSKIGSAYTREELGISFGNQIWVAEGMPISEAYRDDVLQLYTQVDSLNFTNDGPREINAWVEELTHGRIRQLVTSLPPHTQLVMANAVYFNQNWTIPFDKMQDMPFNLLNGSVVNTRMMSREDSNIKFGKFRLSNNFNYEIIRIPYEKPNQNSEFEFQILIPDSKDGKGAEALRNLEDHFESEIKRGDRLKLFKQIQKCANYQTGQVLLKMPRFQWEAQTDASQLLKSMDILDVFTNKSELDRLTGSSNSLAVDNILHRAFINVSLSGTEAAAATLVKIVLLSLPPRPVEVRVDRPFIYMIYDTGRDIPVLVGRMVDPSSRS